MVQLASTLVAAVAGLASVSLAHPGHNVKAEAAERAAFLKRSNVARSWGGCATKLKARDLESRSIARRLGDSAPFLKARDLTALNTSHESSLDVDLFTDPSVLFSSNATCVLASDVTQGPYYVSGELIRSDITEDQAGVPLYVDVQMVDSSTCEPVSGVYLDFWHCNATGVYSGVVANGNGNSNDDGNLDATFLRGLQKTDAEGVAQFHTIFPGHYTGRATHIHVLTHSLNETTVNANNTLETLYTAHSAHVGQIFFDQDLISTVEETSPYSTNTQDLTTNDEDSILAEEADTIEPFVEYVFLGDSVSDGIFAWISLAMDSSESSSVTPAAYYTEDGGVENESSGGGAGGPGGSGSRGPGGAPPS
ncbi:hypothetical protein Aspvir_001937 [Aspergillus viridinutans]|uniref:Intradiol ring-cleavage dioxygenases domain-containing protein n=1 Tax=Aspergillus viridinutans TaxID=75553 RepID=A0A9P3C059_ASPVI|nr:uncharacterized protein Aspvir_001937 [Aspergillus viridinutans]GIK06290.1 hypothetical protein Aspvir_001937 [Aspergillus viridinutans]